MRTVSLLLVLCLLSVSPLFAATAAEHAAAGRIALERDEQQKAADLFAKAVALEPKNAEYHYLLGAAYGELAQKSNVLKQASLAKKTKESFERAIALDPRHVPARFGLISYYLIAPGFMGGGEDKALAQAAALKKLDALDGHRAYARIYAHQKKPDLVRKEFVDAVREQPNSARAHYFLGNAYLNDKNWSAAQHEYDTALKLDPAFMPTYLRLGHLAAVSQTNYARGEEMLRKYLTHKPTDQEPSLATAWWWLGQVQEKQGKRAEAKSSYTRALALAPGDKDVTAALKRVS